MKRRNMLIMTIAMLVVLVGTLVVYGCAAPAPAPAPAPGPTPTPAPAPAPTGPTLDIGVASTLTGPPSALGTQLKNGALLAIEDQNSEGGVTIAGTKYTLNPIIMDTKGNPQDGKAVAEQLVFDKKVKIIVGPCIEDAIGMQPVTEANKVISIDLQVIVPGMCGPDKLYTFFTPGPLLQFYNVTTRYIAEFHPEAKTMITMTADAAETPSFTGPAKQMAELYGIKWLRAELFPFMTRDFSPMIARALVDNPDIIDTGSTGGSMGALCALLCKQLREAGFKGIIMIPAAPPTNSMFEIIPDNYRTNIVDFDINQDSPALPESYRTLYKRFNERFPKAPPFNITGKIYNVTKGFLQFLDGQDEMDTTAWANGFAKYRWQNPWGQESFICGEPLWGINRMCWGSTWCSEFTDGKFETNWEATDLPMNLYVSE